MTCLWTDKQGVREDCDVEAPPAPTYVVAFYDGASIFTEGGVDDTTDGEAWALDTPVPLTLVIAEEVESALVYVADVDSFSEVVTLTEFGSSEETLSPVTSPGFDYSTADDILTVDAIAYAVSPTGQCDYVLRDTLQITAQSAVGEVISSVTVQMFNACA